MQSAAPSPSVSTSEAPQPQTPGSVFDGSAGQVSKQSGVPSASLSTSGVPQPQRPGSVLAGSVRQSSSQSAAPSPSVSVSGMRQPQMPGSVLAGSKGQVSTQSAEPSWSLSVRVGVWLRSRGKHADNRTDDEGYLLSAALALLGLLIAFTFSLALNRYDSRRDFVVLEANAIGTAWLRAGLVEGKAGQSLQQGIAR